MNFFARLTRFGPRGETGAIAVVSAIVIVALIGFVAFSVDIGKSYYYRAQAQAAADAGALAGMQEKLKGGSNGEILAKANEYAILNDLDGHQGTPIALSMVPGGPGTVIGSDFVQVEVTKRANYFFAPVFSLIAAGDYSGGTVKAQALARRVFLMGVKNLVPWGAMQIKATRIFAHDDEGGTVELTKSGGDTWTATLPVPDDEDDDDGYLVDLIIHNGQDFPETFQDIGSVYVHEDDDNDSTLIDAYLGQQTVAEGGSSTLFVRSSGGTADAPTQARIGNSSFNGFTDLGGGLYSRVLIAPGDIDGTFEAFPVQVKFGGSGTYDDVTSLVVRKVTHPIDDITITNGHRPSGGLVTITVSMHDLLKGVVYDLKVASEPEAGNFNSLDYRYITHPDGSEHGQDSSAADYYDNVELGYQGVIHIGDVIQSKTGNLSGPTTTHRLNDRFSLCSYTTFGGWDAAGRPGCSRVVIVPIVERIERMTGVTDVKVIQFGAFFVNEYGTEGGGSNIHGIFIDYAAPGEYTTTPPDTDIYLETSRLEMPGY